MVIPFIETLRVLVELWDRQCARDSVVVADRAWVKIVLFHVPRVDFFRIARVNMFVRVEVHIFELAKVEV